MPVLLILHIVAWISVAVFMRPGIFMALALVLVANALPLWRAGVLGVLYAHLALLIGVAFAAIALAISPQLWSLLVIPALLAGIYAVRPFRKSAGFPPFALAFISGCAAYFLTAEAIAPLFHGDTMTGQFIGPESPDQQRAWYYLYWLMSPLVFWVALVYRLPSHRGTAADEVETPADDSAELERAKKAWGYFWR